MAHSCFIGPVETHACHEGGVGGRLWLGARERETKNEDEVNDIHAGYRILPSRARPRLPSFRLFLPFFPLLVVLARSSLFAFSV